jgi:hypothetical protein
LLKSKRAKSDMPLAPLLGCFVFSVELGFLKVIHAIGASENTPGEVVEILSHDVDIGPIDYFLSCGYFTAV